MAVQVDPTFGSFFEAGNAWFWYMPVNPYRQFSNPIKGLKFTLCRALYYFVLSSLALSMLLGAIYLVKSISSGGDIVEISKGVLWVICTVSAFQSSLFLWNRGPALVELFKFLHDLFPKSDAEKASVGAKIIAKDCRHKNICFATLFYVSFIGTLTGPLFLSANRYWSEGLIKLELPMVLWYPFDPLAMPWYPFVYILEVWFSCVTTFIFMATPSLLGAITMVIKIQFKMLELELHNLDYSGAYQYDLRILQAAIQKHQRALYATKTTRNLFSLQLFFAFAIASINICVLVFLAMMAREPIEYLVYLTGILCYLAYTGAFAFFGNEFIERVSGRENN